MLVSRIFAKPWHSVHPLNYFHILNKFATFKQLLTHTSVLIDMDSLELDAISQKILKFHDLNKKNPSNKV